MIEVILCVAFFLLGYNLKKDKKTTITYSEFKDAEQAFKFKDSIDYSKRVN